MAEKTILIADDDLTNLAILFDYLQSAELAIAIDSDTHQHQERFITEFLIMVVHRLEFLGLPNLSQLVEEHRPEITNLPALSRFITKLVGTRPTKSWVLMIDEDIIPNRACPERSRRADKNWSVDDVEAAFKMIVDDGYTTTLFDSLTKNLENNQELYELIFHIVINGKSLNFCCQ